MPSHDIIYEGLEVDLLDWETHIGGTWSASDALPRSETEFTRLLSYDISGLP